MHRYLIAAVLGFLSGSVMYSYYLPLVFCHVDIIKESEDHNPGMANAALYGGRVIGGICLVLDVLKGFLPVFISARVLDSANPLFGLAVAAPVLGHAFTPAYAFSRRQGNQPRFRRPDRALADKRNHMRPCFSAYFYHLYSDGAPPFAAYDNSLLRAGGYRAYKRTGSGRGGGSRLYCLRAYL